MEKNKLTNQNPNFEIQALDHVAIRVADMDVSIDWYERVLGLKKQTFPEWGEFPVFMMIKKTGVALFPADPHDPKLDSKSKNVGIDHFAFQVTADNFTKARAKYDDLGINYTFQDHTYYHSIYTRDPDGHIVELTTQVLPQ